MFRFRAMRAVAVSAVVAGAAVPAMAQTFTLPADLVPATVVTSLLTNNSSSMLVYAGASIAITIFLGFIWGLKNKGKKAAK